MDVPIHHWSYGAVERLAAMGLCKGLGLGMRPVTRDWMAERISEALKTVEEKDLNISPELASQIEEDLLRLSYEFALELKQLGISVLDDEKIHQPGQPFRWKEIAFQTGFLNEGLLTSFKRDTSSSLIENSQGFRLKDGFNGRWQLPSWLGIGDWFAVTLDPSLRTQKGDSADLDFEEASAKVAYQNLEVKAGDLNFWWGPGYHGALLLTNNPRPLQAFSLRTRNAFQLPWKFKCLGSWQAQLMGAQLEEKATPSRPRLAGTRLEWSPHRRIVAGLSHTTLYGGKGETDRFSTFFKAIDPTTGGGETERADHLAGGDIRFFFPEFARWVKLGSGLELYGELYGEDTTGFYIPIFTSTLEGLLITDLFTWRGLDFRFEGAKTDAIAYEHFVYKSGYRFKNEFIGHSLGEDADDIFLRLTQEFFLDEKRFVGGVQFNRERHGLSGAPLSFGQTPRIRNEFQIDLLHEFSKQLEMAMAYQFEDIKNFQGSSGVDSKNHIVTLQTTFRF